MQKKKKKKKKIKVVGGWVFFKRRGLQLYTSISVGNFSNCEERPLTKENLANK